MDATLDATVLKLHFWRKLGKVGKYCLNSPCKGCFQTEACFVAGKSCLIGRCNLCKPCTKMWCFSATADTMLYVETTGEHAEKRDPNGMKRLHADTYGQRLTPGQTLKKMREDGVPPDERPEIFMLKNRRPKQSEEKCGQRFVLGGF